MLTKLQLQQTIENLPNEFSIDSLIEELLLVEKINRAEHASLTNQIKTEQETEKIIDSWFQ